MQRMNFIQVLLSLLVILAPTAVLAQSDTLDVRQVMDRMDRLYRSQRSYSEVEMVVTNPNWERSMRLEIWGEGLKKTFIAINSPKKDAGIATLRLGNEMWNYFPKIDKVMKVPPSMMMGAWMGSDFTNDDLVKESTFLEDYDARAVAPPDAEAGLAYFDLVAKEDAPTVWGRIEIVVQRQDLIPLRQVYYDEDGRKMRRMDFLQVRDLGGRRVPTLIEIVPLHKEGHKTAFRYMQAQFDGEIEPELFTLRNLRQKR